jgi:hypothetical protein
MPLPNVPRNEVSSEPSDAETSAVSPEGRRKAMKAVAHVYVPTRPSDAVGNSGTRQVEFELRLLPDGTNALPVFTELDLLVEQLGEYQPWEKTAVLHLLVQVSAAGIPVVVNPTVRADTDQWTAARIDEWNRGVR